MISCVLVKWASHHFWHCIWWFPFLLHSYYRSYLCYMVCLNLKSWIVWDLVARVSSFITLITNATCLLRYNFWLLISCCIIELALERTVSFWFLITSWYAVWGLLDHCTLPQFFLVAALLVWQQTIFGVYKYLKYVCLCYETLVYTL